MIGKLREIYRQREAAAGREYVGVPLVISLDPREEADRRTIDDFLQKHSDYIPVPVGGVEIFNILENIAGKFGCEVVLRYHNRGNGHIDYFELGALKDDSFYEGLQNRLVKSSNMSAHVAGKNLHDAMHNLKHVLQIGLKKTEKHPGEKPKKPHAKVHVIVREYLIVNQCGMHARPAAMFVKSIADYDSEVYVKKEGSDDNRVSGKSIMGLMTLGAGKGSKLKVRVEGHDAEEVIDAIDGLMRRHFDED